MKHLNNNPKNTAISVRLTHGERASLTAYAQRKGITVADAARQAINTLKK
jgi:hypothetical protein